MSIDLASIEGIFKNRRANLLGHEQMRIASVLLPLLEKDGQTHVLFQVRGKRLRTQPGEICFPGGGVERQDKNEAETAIRETCEELGLEKQHIKMVAPLDLYVTPFHAIIYPYVGVILQPEAICPDDFEVEEVFTVPLDYLLNYKPKQHPVHLQVKPDDSFPYHLIPRGKYYKWRTGQVPEYFYFYDKYVIWGLTARILTNFLTVIKGQELTIK
ncbi:NUDIX hydrolase [Pueribacillus sp. YX66]|uniref:NUDIX hydrolase n=1 Tax=Pueribacillus sp. YX66 TaxID=3229242 RepID=UPI00358D349F